MKVGQILCSSWGYDQTNIDFYEVVERTEKSVYLRMLGKKTSEILTSMSRKVEPDQMIFRGSRFIKKVKVYNGEPYVSINSFSCAFPWDGKPKVETSYA